MILDGQFAAAIATLSDEKLKSLLAARVADHGDPPKPEPHREPMPAQRTPPSAPWWKQTTDVGLREALGLDPMMDGQERHLEGEAR